MDAVEVAFWCSAFLISYTVLGYPLLALLLGTIWRRDPERAELTPTMTLIIAAYNEEDAIAEKIEQSLALDYPEEKLEILVADDGSTDRTTELVRSFADRGVRLHRCEGRVGKTATLNEAVSVANGEILVFSDATTVYGQGSLRELAANFADPSVGCVSGRVAYHYGEDVASSGFRVYQHLAVAVRRAEGRFGSTTSVSGAIHALRRELFRPAAPEFTADLSNPLHTVVQGRRVIYENSAVGLERSRTRFRDEYRARVRNGVLHNSMIRYIVKELIAARRFAYLFQMVSHKFLRWWLGPLLVLALLANLVLISHGTLYAALAVVQLALLIVGAIAVATEGSETRIPGASSLGFFLVGNAGMCVGMLRWLRGGGLKTWEPIR
jgi:cellulose synthase/poly-beta-1,6-N-acetylglucosamine synthase-like glycosyltransferase